MFIERQLYLFGSWEATETAFLKRIVKSGDTVLDVGANIGYFTVLLSLLVGPSGRVFGIEPTQSTYEQLVKNVEINRLDNVTLCRVALSDKSGSVQMYHHRGATRVPILSSDTTRHQGAKKYRPLRLTNWLTTIR